VINFHKHGIRNLYYLKPFFPLFLESHHKVDLQLQLGLLF